MEKTNVSLINPDLVIGKESAIDRMGSMASRARDKQHPNFNQQIQLVRRAAGKLCDNYRNCREHDWCFLCASGQNGQPLFRGKECLGCKLLSADVLVDNPKLLRIKNNNNEARSKESNKQSP